MSKTISAREMADHIRRLSEAVEIMQQIPSVIDPVDYGRARGLVRFTRDELVDIVAAPVVIEGDVE